MRPHLLRGGILVFPREREADFLERQRAIDAPLIRIAAFVALGVYLASAIAGSTQFGAPGRPVRLLYLVYVCPGIALWLAATFFARTRVWIYEITAISAVFFLGAAQMLSMLLLPDRAALFEPVGAVLLTAAVYSTLRLPFLYSAAAGAAIGFSFVWSAHRSGAFAPAFLAQAAIYVLLANIIGGVTAFLLERGARREFLQQRLLEEERRRSDALLLNILPQSIADRLKAGERTIADYHPEVAVLFADIVGYTTLAASLPPHEVVSLLGDIFARFDAITERCGVEKIKTIGDAYMAVAGLTTSAGASAIADAALAMLGSLEEVNRSRGAALSLRIGIHSGGAVAGVIGTSKFSYDLWGDTVNVASRMESTGIAGKIQVSEAFSRSLERTHVFAARGPVDVKGLGLMETHWLIGRH